MSACQNCGERPGTLQWVGDMGSLAAIHGMGRMWCEPCVLDAQIEHSEQCAARLPELKARRTEVTVSDAHPR